MDYDNTNKGVLFRNDKQGNERRPDYRGNLNVNGQEFKLRAWIREKKDGRGKFMSLSVEPKDAQPAPQPSRTPISDHNRAKATPYVRPQDDPDCDPDEQIPF